ncbi:MAG: beta galactosidase jelly roll domain-containing protein [Clostridia bacterium]|nr:beta galactosidase jelly roll domain-containing protein [Clostridia bacterium]
MQHVRCYKSGYPRPQLVKKDFRDLCGEWSFAFDDAHLGEKQGWFLRFPEARAITVPYSYQTKKSGIAEDGLHDTVWYRTELTYQTSELSGSRLLLHFEGCDYQTKVWVNGSYVGMHRGGYCRFTFDITNEVLAAEGKAVITVKAEDTLEAIQPRGKQSAVGGSVGCWYQNTVGIWKPVWTEIVPDCYLKSVKITPSIKDYYVEFEATLSEYREGYALRTVVSFGGNTVSDTVSRFTRRILNVKADLNYDGDIFRVLYWTPDRPNLYDVQFYLVKESEVVEEAGSYFGLAECRAEGNCIMLNCNPIYLQMVLAQGYYGESGLTAPDEQAFVKDILLAKELGFNGIRMHQKIEDERFYYYADILGMAIWCEMPSAYEYKSETAEKVAAEWMEAVRQNYNHPSVLTWVPINESWGVPRIVTDAQQQAFSLALYYATKAYDARRPVISNDGWEHTVSDIVSLHNYTQSAEELTRFYSQLNEALAGNNRVGYSQLRLPFANGFGYQGEPVVISEFAGIGYKNGAESGWGYGDMVKDSASYVGRLRELVAALKKIDGISGFCVTQLTDVETEINGLTDINRVPKAPIEELKKAITQQ